MKWRSNKWSQKITRATKKEIQFVSTSVEALLTSAELKKELPMINEEFPVAQIPSTTSQLVELLLFTYLSFSFLFFSLCFELLVDVISKIPTFFSSFPRYYFDLRRNIRGKNEGILVPQSFEMLERKKESKKKKRTIMLCIAAENYFPFTVLSCYTMLASSQLLCIARISVCIIVVQLNNSRLFLSFDEEQEAAAAAFAAKYVFWTLVKSEDTRQC